MTEKEYFVQQYTKLQESCRNDTEIARAMGYSARSLSTLKNKYGIRSRRKRFTQEQIRAAEANGISHNRLWDRVVNWGWDIERAISEPVKRWDKAKSIREKVSVSTLPGNGLIDLYNQGK